MTHHPASSEQAADRRRFSGEWGYGVAVMLPTVAFISILAVGAYREHAARQRLQSEMVAWTEAGTPADNHLSTVAFDRRLSRENSIAWQNLLSSTEMLSERFASIDNSFFDEIGVTDELPSDPWTSEPIIREYTDQAAPILARMEELVRDDRPVWQPLVLQGFDTLLPDLQASRGLVNMLTAEFRHALHQGDQQRAIRALKLILGVGDAFDWQIGIVSDFIYFSHRSAHRTLIRKSVERGLWQDKESLEQLRQQLSEHKDLGERWRRMIDGERAMLLFELRVDGDNPQYEEPPLALFPFGIPPTIATQVLGSLDSARDIAGAGTLRHLRAVEQQIDMDKQDASETFTVTGIPFAVASSSLGLFQSNHASLASVFAYQAMERRWTLTAVALRQFRLQQGRWPEKLSELEKVGLPRSEWMAIGERPFGYQVSDDGAEAILWTAKPADLRLGEGAVSPTPPSESEDDREVIEMVELRLR